MNQKDKPKVVVPPHMSFKTLRAFLGGLRNNPIPGRIDRSLMSSLSGTVKSQLVHTLHYLGLLGDEDAPTESLVRLVGSEGANQQAEWNQILRSCYDFLFAPADGSFDLAKSTQQQFEEQFRKAGASGTTVAKCTRFFLAAAKEAGLQLSPYIAPARSRQLTSQRVRPLQTAPSAKPARRRPVVRTADAEPQPAALGWHHMLLAKFPTFDPKWDEETKAKWFESFRELMRLAGPDPSEQEAES